CGQEFHDGGIISERYDRISGLLQECSSSGLQRSVPADRDNQFGVTHEWRPFTTEESFDVYPQQVALNIEGRSRRNLSRIEQLTRLSTYFSCRTDQTQPCTGTLGWSLARFRLLGGPIPICVRLQPFRSVVSGHSAIQNLFHFFG